MASESAQTADKVDEGDEVDEAEEDPRSTVSLEAEAKAQACPVNTGGVV